MELDWLEDFVALAKAKNLTRAAEARNVTQPAFSRRLRAFEAWLGAPLFERGPRGSSLNAAGERAAAHAADIADRIHAFRREMRDIAATNAAGLRFAATHALSFSFFPGWIREDAGSLGAIRLISDSMAACAELFRRGEVEFLLCHHDPRGDDPFAAARFRGVTIGVDQIRAYSAPDAAGAPRFRLDPGGRHELAYGEGSGIGRIVAGRRGTATPSPAFTSELAATLLSLAVAGEGVAWLPATLAADALRDGRLAEAGGPDDAIDVDIRLYRPLSRLPRAAETFWDRIADDRRKRPPRSVTGSATPAP